MILKWHGRYTFGELLTDVRLEESFDRPGVYIQTEKQGDVEFASYIGKSHSSLVSRQFEHYRKCIGGLYTIPSYIRKSDKPFVPYIPNPEYHDIILDKNRFLELVSEGFDYAASIGIYFCGLEAASEIKGVERNLLYQIKPIWSYWGTLSKPHKELTFEFDGVLQNRKDELILNTRNIKSQYKEDIEYSHWVVYGKH